MKLSLKNIKYSEHASQETNNFVAELYVDGKPFALVHNEGTGGCDMHHKHDKNPQSYSDFNQELNRIIADRMGWFNNQMWQKFQENWVCINNMPIDEAVAYYKAN